MCQETNSRKKTKLAKQGARSTQREYTEYCKTFLQQLQPAPLSQQLPDPLTPRMPNALLTSIVGLGLVPSYMQEIKGISMQTCTCPSLCRIPLHCFTLKRLFPPPLEKHTKCFLSKHYRQNLNICKFKSEARDSSDLEEIQTSGVLTWVLKEDFFHHQ